MTAAWDRDEAMRVAERLAAVTEDDAYAEPWTQRVACRNAAVLLRAADAEITRLRAREEAAEKMAEALRERDGGVHDEDCKYWRPTHSGICNCGHKEAVAALAAWDASREGGR